MLGLGLGVNKGGFIGKTINQIVEDFKNRVTLDSGIFEAEYCLYYTTSIAEGKTANEALINSLTNRVKDTNGIYESKCLTNTLNNLQ